MNPGDIDLDFVPRLATGVVAVELDGEAVVYDNASGRLHLLNPTATVLWSCFDGSGSLRQIVGDLAEAFGRSDAEIAHDVLELTRQLAGQGLLDGVDAREDVRS